jgi:hypothetical protein
MYIYKERENLNPAIFLYVCMPKFDRNHLATVLSHWDVMQRYKKPGKPDRGVLSVLASGSSRGSGASCNAKDNGTRAADLRETNRCVLPYQDAPGC